ncbi:MAG: ankyrin repeat domain-containing protein [Nostoc sp.]|uniref:ankyrin repeat domain-containing protein n=1 Tax=Nostoc sp. TaxID=1180 RepID=UPI002FF48EE7
MPDYELSYPRSTIIRSISVPDNFGKCCNQVIFNSQQEVAEFLIKNGVDINAKDSNGNTALDIATMRYEVKIALMLLEKGAIANRESDSERLRDWQQELKNQNNK